MFLKKSFTQIVLVALFAISGNVYAANDGKIKTIQISNDNKLIDSEIKDQDAKAIANRNSFFESIAKHTENTFGSFAAEIALQKKNYPSAIATYLSVLKKYK